MIILSFLSAVLLHECGHLLALVFFKAPITKARISLFGITLSHAPLSLKRSFTVSAFGPLFGLIGYLLAPKETLPLFSSFSLLFSLFNLLPIKTLDGARMLTAALASFLAPTSVELVSSCISKCALLVLWLLGSYLFLFKDQSPSLFLMALALFFESSAHES